jgi:hypothetical protein
MSNPYIHGPFSVIPPHPSPSKPPALIAYQSFADKENLPTVGPSQGWLNKPAWIGKGVINPVTYNTLIVDTDGGVNPPVFYHSHE